MTKVRASIGHTLLAAVAGLGLLSVGEAAFAKCGDGVDDLDKVAATRADMIAQCDCSTAASHSAHVQCARGVVDAAVVAGTLPPQCASTVMRCARKSTCGRKPGFVPCCRTSHLGITRCRITAGAARCRAPQGGSACASTFATSCCESCNNGGCIQATPTPTATPKPTPTPPGFCQSLVGLPRLGQVPISLLPGTAECGGPIFVPPPQAPFSGVVYDSLATEPPLAHLGLGCLYTGMLPPTKLPSGSSSILDVVGIGLPTITLAGSEGTGPSDCTKGAGPLQHCANGAPGSDGMGLCATDADCDNTAGTCLLDGNCFFGPPVPVPGEYPGCAVNALLSDMCGSLNVSTFEVNFALTISSRIYLTFDAQSPCPQCVPETVGGALVCSGGKNMGLPCAPLGNYNTSPNCPPLDAQFVAALQVVIPNLTTGTSALTADENGSFCEGQTGPGAFGEAGAFGLTSAAQVTQTGQGITDGGLSLSGETIAVGTFCIYPSGNPIIDFSGGFPAVGSLSAKSSINVADILLP